MKQADVKIGGQYLTRIAGELALVEVIGVREIRSWGASSRMQKRYMVRRVGARARGVVATLPKARTAAALREVCPRTVALPPVRELTAAEFDAQRQYALRDGPDSDYEDFGTNPIRTTPDSDEPGDLTPPRVALP